MKKLVVREETTSSKVVETKFADFYKFYGVETKDHTRGFIIRENYDDNKYKIVITEEMTYANSLWMLTKECKSLNRYLEYLLDKDATVYQFDKMSELALWIEEDY